MSKARVIESGSNEGVYEISCDWAIVDHPKHGRLYVAQGYGGEDGIEGGTYRWRHGIVCRLLPGDTIETLGELYDTESGYEISILDGMIQGYDAERPVLGWAGYMIDRMISATQRKAGVSE